MNDMTQIATGIARIAAVLRTERWYQAADLGLSTIQADIVVYLDARGGMTQSALAGLLGVTQPTASDAIAALKRKALLEARANPSDGRSRMLVLTSAGQAAATALSVAPEKIVDALGAVRQSDVAAMARGLTAVIQRLQLNGAIAPQRLCAGCAHFRSDAHPGAAKPHHCAFVDAAFGDAELRFDCGDFHEAGRAPSG